MILYFVLKRLFPIISGALGYFGEIIRWRDVHFIELVDNKLIAKDL